MQQIKNYLSSRFDIKTFLLLSKTDEFDDLENWLKQKKRMQKADVCNGQTVDAVIFDWDCEEALLCVTDYRPKYLIGRMRKDEDYFKIWEIFRDISLEIYIEQDRGLPLEQITADVASCEILYWNKADDNMELSVVVPVYNVKNYLSKCVESLIKWQAPYVEYLFVNDGSSDGSDEIIRRYAKQDKRIRLINKENSGCASARNLGIKEAKGRYIGFVDADDFVDEKMFERLLRRAIMGNYEMVYCGYKEYYEEDGTCKEVLNDCLKEPYLTGTYREDKIQLLAVNTRVAIWRAIYRKEVFERSSIWFHEDMKRFDDLPFRVEYIFAAKSATCVPEHLYYYRLGRNGQDVSCADDRLFVHFTMFEHLDEYVDKFKNQRLKDLLQVVKIQTHGYALSKLEKKYRKEYIKRAKAQLDRNMGYFRTVSLIMMYTGKRNLGWYTRMKIMVGKEVKYGDGSNKLQRTESNC